MRKLNRRRADHKTNMLRKLSPIVTTIPMGVLAASFVMFFYRQSLPGQLVAALNTACYILVAVGIGLCAGFNRSRVLLVLFLVGLGQFALTGPVPAGYNPKAFAGIMFYFVSLLLPVNILLFALIRERGLKSWLGKAGVMVILVQLLGVAVVIVSQDKEMLAYINKELAAPPFGWKTPLHWWSLVVIGAGAALLALRQLVRRLMVDNAFLATLLALAAAFHYKDVQGAIPLFFSAAAVVLTVAAIQESYAIAYLDELTGLPSRRALREELAKLSDKYTVAMVDIDYFKKFNDKYGHSVGDDVLRFIATIINREVSDEAKPFRYGGEEFTLLFPGKTAGEVLPVLEELRQMIAKRSFFMRGKAKEKKLSVTVSIGLAERGGDARTPEEVLKAADDALYRAKENGRNCVCM